REIGIRMAVDRRCDRRSRLRENMDQCGKGGRSIDS
ncbi:hypothetical protein LTSEURB_1388, partial [Salmonella enterica subsp. enterica serovar Urbana str. R8-2977]